jgi:lactate dehydrogenase-like 2-hydroxyacid dehydrogenase
MSGGDVTVLLYGGMTAELRGGLNEAFRVVEWSAHAEKEALFASHGAAIRGVATSGVDGLPPAIMDRLPALEIVSCYGVGYDGIDARAAAARNVMVTHTPGVLNDEVANTALALLLATTRRVVAYDRYVREGRWAGQGSPPLTRGLAGKKVGIVGFGRIGQVIADKLAIFHVETMYHARNKVEGRAERHCPDLVAMARECDILIAILPGGAGTRRIIGKEVLEALGPQGTFINVARGSVCDEAELIAALRDGRLGAAGLDVFENEPKVPSEFFAMDNVVLLPHVGSATVETRKAMADLTIDNLKQWFAAGKAITPVPECRRMQP